MAHELSRGLSNEIGLSAKLCLSDELCRSAELCLPDELCGSDGLCISDELYLPSELWETVLGFLPHAYHFAARDVCRAWRDCLERAAPQSSEQSRGGRQLWCQTQSWDRVSSST